MIADPGTRATAAKTTGQRIGPGASTTIGEQRAAGQRQHGDVEIAPEATRSRVITAPFDRAIGRRRARHDLAQNANTLPLLRSWHTMWPQRRLATESANPTGAPGSPPMAPGGDSQAGVGLASALRARRARSSPSTTDDQARFTSKIQPIAIRLTRMLTVGLRWGKSSAAHRTNGLPERFRIVTQRHNGQSRPVGQRPISADVTVSGHLPTSQSNPDEGDSDERISWEVGRSSTDRASHRP